MTRQVIYVPVPNDTTKGRAAVLTYNETGDITDIKYADGGIKNKDQALLDMETLILADQHSKDMAVFNSAAQAVYDWFRAVFG